MRKSQKERMGGFRRRPKYRTGSFISIPLKIGEKTIGVLNISDKITGEVFSKLVLQPFHLMGRTERNSYGMLIRRFTGVRWKARTVLWSS